MVNPLVAEAPGKLKHPLHSSDHETFKVELRRNAKVQVLIKRVVVRNEGPGVCAAGKRLQDRRLNLKVCVFFKKNF